MGQSTPTGETMGGSFSGVISEEEGHAWDMRWSELEQGSGHERQLEPSNLFQPTQQAGCIHHGEEEHVWDVRWSQLEQNLALKVHREAMAASVQRQLQQVQVVGAQEIRQERVPKATNSDNCVEGEAVVTAAARAAGA